MPNTVNLGFICINQMSVIHHTYVDKFPQNNAQHFNDLEFITSDENFYNKSLL